MNRHLHIICLDNPYPADYGGAIDMFYKIKSLAELDIKIHLHYFSYNERQHTAELNPYCQSIQVYKRRTGIKGLSFHLPYIVSSRINKQLIENLKKDEYPILLEGIHCSGLLPWINENNRRILLRIHNDEAAYYTNLFKAEKNIFRKLYYAFETYQLKKYQKQLPQNIEYACISEKEMIQLKTHHDLKNSHFLPAFVGWQKVNTAGGMGDYCLYHGNLAIAENEVAANWLIHAVFSKTDIPLMIAGSEPSAGLQKLVEKFSNITLIKNPTIPEINELLKNAQINVLPAFTETGVKLKLLHALFEGRHCVVNNSMISGTGLKEACTIANDSAAMIASIEHLFYTPITESEIEAREKILKMDFDNQRNAEKIIHWLYS